MKRILKIFFIFLLLIFSLNFLSCSISYPDKNPENSTKYNSESTIYETDPGKKPSELKVYITGNKKFIKKNPKGGFLLQGGGKDVDEAFLWLINQSDGGDFIVLRTDDSKGYNDWIYYDLKGVNSVYTLVVNSYNLANTDYVEKVIENADAIFIAGGDQTKYYNYWKGTKLENAIKKAHIERNVPIGGTSAGMAVLGEFDYIPYNLGVLSDEALSNPYNQNMNYIKNDFLENFNLFKNTIFDTHFYERKRMGRLVSFLARIITDYKLNYSDVKGIACDEETAICVDSNGIGRIFGYGYAFFLRGNAPIEKCRENQPLDWYGDKKAIKCFRLAGTKNGIYKFDFIKWNTEDTKPYFIWVDLGTLYPEKVY
jgi:cyanophycinase